MVWVFAALVVQSPPPKSLKAKSLNHWDGVHGKGHALVLGNIFFRFLAGLSGAFLDNFFNAFVSNLIKLFETG